MEKEKIISLPKVALGITLKKNISAEDLDDQFFALSAQNIRYAEFLIHLEDIHTFREVAQNFSFRKGLILDAHSLGDIKKYLSAREEYEDILAVEIAQELVDEAASLLRDNYVPFSVKDNTGALAARVGAHRIVDPIDIYEDFDVNIDSVDGIEPGRISAFIRDRRIPVAVHLYGDLLDHPLPLLHSMGYQAVLIGNNPSHDLSQLSEFCDYEEEELLSLIRMMAESSFLPQLEKQQLLHELEVDSYEEEDTQEENTQVTLTKEEFDSIDPAFLEELGIDPKDLRIEE